MTNLQPPGAGLPFFTSLLLRYIAGPILSKRSSWENSQELFNREGVRILSLLPEKKMHQQVLIKPLQGLEDSSRNWSIAMTLDHLLITGRQMQQAMVSLSKGIPVNRTVSVAAVKPSEQKNNAKIQEEFLHFLQVESPTSFSAVENWHSPLTLTHPWFGPMNPVQWAWLLGRHQQIHRRQIEEISKELSK